MKNMLRALAPLVLVLLPFGTPSAAPPLDPADPITFVAEVPIPAGSQAISFPSKYSGVYDWPNDLSPNADLVRLDWPGDIGPSLFDWPGDIGLRLADWPGDIGPKLLDRSAYVLAGN